MDSRKEQRIAVKFCVLVILDKKFPLHLNDRTVSDKRGRDLSSGMAQISQRRGAKYCNKT